MLSTEQATFLIPSPRIPGLWGIFPSRLLKIRQDSVPVGFCDETALTPQKPLQVSNLIIKPHVYKTKFF